MFSPLFGREIGDTAEIYRIHLLQLLPNPATVYWQPPRSGASCLLLSLVLGSQANVELYIPLRSKAIY